MTRNCRKCGAAIPTERLEALPDTVHCVGCSTTQKNVTFMVQDGKTAAYAVPINVNGPGGQERLRQATRAHRRGR